MTYKPHGILNLPGRTLPLALDHQLPDIYKLYLRSCQQSWNPDTAIPWNLFNIDNYTKEQQEAGRIYWSRRAWGEYGAISESPAFLLRFDLEQREPDLSLYWSLRTLEEARHTDICRRMADLLGGYHLQPDEVELEATAGALGTRDRILNAEISLESVMAGLGCVAETVVYDVFIKLVRHVSDPTAKQIVRLILRDEVRHCEFAWKYLEHRAPSLSSAELDDCRMAMISMITDVELAGYRSAWLSEDPVRSEVWVDEVVFDACLGGTRAEWEAPIVTSSIANIRRRAAGLGIDLPVFQHHLLGEV